MACQNHNPFPPPPMPSRLVRLRYTLIITSRYRLPAVHVFEAHGPVHDIDNIAMERAADLAGHEIPWNTARCERGVWLGQADRSRFRLFRETD